MISVISHRKQTKGEFRGYLPTVALVLPFEPKMEGRIELDMKLKSAILSIESALMKSYSIELALPLLHKLQVLIRNLNFHTHKRSLAVFVSPVAEKVIYLDFPVEEKIVVGELFRIRDILTYKKKAAKCLLLLLSAAASRMYYSNCSDFILIKSNVADWQWRANSNEAEKETGKPFSALPDQKMLFDKFLHCMDEGLTLVLRSSHLPVFVFGENDVISQFRKTTKNSKSIVKYITGNYLQINSTELKKIMGPYIDSWESIKQKNSLQQIAYAQQDGKLVAGIDESWAAAMHGNCKLLVVEKDYVFASLPEYQEHFHENEIHDLTKPFYIKDRVDLIVEKILECGGDVDFVGNGLLRNLEHIAAIKFF